MAEKTAQTLEQADREMNARGLLEIAKTLGQVDVVPCLKLFTREYFKKGQIVYLDDNHPAEVMKDNICPTPFLFVTSSDVTGGEPGLYECDDDESALCLLSAVFTEFKKAIGIIDTAKTEQL